MTWQVIEADSPEGLERLRRVAENADDGGRDWTWLGGYPQPILVEGPVTLVAECFENPDYPSRFAEFITTFDPPTVLALLDRIQRKA